MIGQRPECFICAHFVQAELPPGTRMTARCQAYPDGIPPDIFFDNEPHHERREDQENDLVFTPKDEEAARESGVPMKKEERRFRRLPTVRG